MKVGLFFGSYNPVHNGHLRIANSMVEKTDLDKVWLVVSPQNPFKKRSNLIHEFDRIKMVELAIEEHYGLMASDVEFHLPKPSYTIDTLTYLQSRHPDTEFVLIMGEDNLLHFHKWKNHESILDYYSIYVYPRQGLDREPELKTHPKVTLVDFPLLPISSTEIRKLVRNGKSISELVPAKVEAYIEEKGLYL